mgnify:FL=1
MNPLLKDSDHKFKTVNFNDIKLEHFMPAVNEGIKQARENIDNIKSNADSPTFQNTIVALETSEETLSRAVTVYFHLFGSESTPEFQALANEISPILASFSNDINLDQELFQKVKYVHDNEYDNLEHEEQRLLEITYKSFVRNGAELDDIKKGELRKVDEELSVLSPKFSNNTLGATNEFELWLSEDDLEGLPEMYLESAKMAAKAKNRPDEWLVTLQMPSMYPFMQFSKRRDLREKLSMAMGTKCTGGKFDNRELIKRIVNLNHKRAQILGYSDYAEFILEKRMAKDKDVVMKFLDDLYDSSYSIAVSEVEDLKAYAKKIDGLDDFRTWDVAYYTEKLKKELFDLDEDSLRPYFKSENVVNGVFKIAEKLYGLTFERLNDVQVYHEDVKVYEVKDSDGSHIGVLYEDLYPRAGKRSGAWMNELQSQGLIGGEIRRPHVTFTCNLTKSTETKPSLLTYSEVETIFHEFGHCLHGLLSDCKYTSVGGTSVYWDFVELPSQIMENWVGEKEALSLFAHHYETGEVIPEDLIDKINKSKNFMQGSMYLRQLSFGYLDMAFYGQDNQVEDVLAHEEKALDKTRLLPKVEGVSIACSFGHIFAGGYSAGYYSYKWAEVLEADAFAKFKEDGIFNKETASSFRENVLSKGNLHDPMDLYKKFRGREPKIEALLERDGLLK